MTRRMIRDIRTSALALFALMIVNVFHPAHAAPLAEQATETPVAADARFTVETVGKGDDVILIPGLSSPRAVWDGAKAAIGGDHRLHLVQIRGFGGDDAGPNASGPMLDATVEQLAAYIRDKHLDHPAVVGHSLGGLIGLALARRHPDLVGKLMVVDSLPYVGVIFVPGATVDMLRPQAMAMRDAMAAGYGKPADPGVMQQIAATNALKPESQAKVAAWAAAADPRASANALYDDLTTDLRGEMAAITTPITLVYPWSAARGPQAKTDALYHGEYAAAPNVTYVPVADSGHFVMLDQPAAFEAALTQFAAP